MVVVVALMRVKIGSGCGVDESGRVDVRSLDEGLNVLTVVFKELHLRSHQSLDLRRKCGSVRWCEKMVVWYGV